MDVECDNTTGEWDYEKWTIKLGKLTQKTKCSLKFTKYPYLNDYIINKSETDKIIQKVTHSKTEQTEENALVDYRYSGSNDEVNNWVCFGSEITPCPLDNLYRIIGVIPTQSTSDGTYENRVKLIKASNYEGTNGIESNSSYTKSGKGYRWNTNNSKAWESSSLKGILNGEYYNSLGEYQKYIDNTKWYLGAPNDSSYTTYTPEQFYTIERSDVKGESCGETSYVDKIGLMYPSDYGYSIDGGVNGEVWKSQSIYNNGSHYQSSVWLYQLEGKYYEWMISPEATYFDSWRGMGSISTVYPNGYVYHQSVSYSSHIFGVRPVFYLRSKVMYKSGTGKSNDPYYILSL